MADSLKILDQMRHEPPNLRYGDLKKVREEFFGKPRQAETPAMRSSRRLGSAVPAQYTGGQRQAKAYLLRQVILAIDKLEGMRYEH